MPGKQRRALGSTFCDEQVGSVCVCAHVRACGRVTSWCGIGERSGYIMMMHDARIETREAAVREVAKLFRL